MFLRLLAKTHACYNIFYLGNTYVFLDQTLMTVTLL